MLFALVPLPQSRSRPLSLLSMSKRTQTLSCSDNPAVPVEPVVIIIGGCGRGLRGPAGNAGDSAH